MRALPDLLLQQHKLHGQSADFLGFDVHALAERDTFVFEALVRGFFQLAVALRGCAVGGEMTGRISTLGRCGGDEGGARSDEGCLACGRGAGCSWLSLVMVRAGMFRVVLAMGMDSSTGSRAPTRRS